MRVTFLYLLEMKLADSRIVVLGGGISGIAAAWRLRQTGASVTLLEARTHLGGRLASHKAPDLPTAFDNGPHLFLSSYARARRLFKELGIQANFEYPYPGAIPFIRSDGQRGRLREWPLPAPLNFAGGLLAFPALPWPARRRAFLAARALLGVSPDEPMDAEGWLDSHSEPEERSIFWEPLIQAALNARPSEISAQNLRTLFKLGFCRRPFGGRLGYATRPLGEIFGRQAQSALEQAGIEVRLKAAGVGLKCESDTIKGIVLQSGEVIACEFVVAALPPWALADWLKGSSAGAQIISEYRLQDWRANPITCMYFWGDDRPLLDGYTCLPGRRAEWVFDFARLWGDMRAPLGVILNEAANGLGAQRAAPLQSRTRTIPLEGARSAPLQDIVGELISAFPQLGPVRWMAGKQVSEKRATPLRPRELWGKTLSQETPIRGLYLAGDWLDPELPPTIEAAVRVGENVKKCAKP
jgi:hypothetical protein